MEGEGKRASLLFLRFDEPAKGRAMAVDAAGKERPTAAAIAGQTPIAASSE